ncbi:hypothetical protein [Arenimonas caeni]|nr:hypothetical protein [Arenimonas caeni]
MTLSGGLFAVALALAAAGLLPWLPRRRKRTLRPQPRRGWTGRALGALLLSLALLIAGTGVLLRQYHWLVADVPVASIELRQLGSQHFEATLVLGDAPPRVLELRGDQWQLDARVIRWTLPAQLSGLAPVYRFERLSGRYAEPAQEHSAERSVHDLREGWDFWEFRQQWLAGLPIADARWGSAAYLPMIDGARFTVSLNPQGGLVATPADPRTELLLQQAGW